MNLVLLPVAVVLAILVIGLFEGQDDPTWDYSGSYDVLSRNKRVRRHKKNMMIQYDGRIFDNSYNAEDEVWFPYDPESPLINEYQKAKIENLGWNVHLLDKTEES